MKKQKNGWLGHLLYLFMLKTGDFMQLTDEQKAKIKKYSIIALICFVSVFVIFVISSLRDTIKTLQNSIYEMKYEQTTKKKDIQEKFGVDDKSASQIANAIQKIHDGQTQPSVSYTINTPDVNIAQKEVERQIETKDATAPKVLTEKADKNIVTNDGTKVDVYKINLRNNHKIKVGSLMTYDNGSVHGYIGGGYQAGRVEVMAYYGGINHYAGTVNYTLKEW